MGENIALVFSEKDGRKLRRVGTNGYTIAFDHKQIVETIFKREKENLNLEKNRIVLTFKTLGDNIIIF